MRAEEGDETVEDYAAEGEQALDKINDARRSTGNPFTRLGRRLLRLLPGTAQG